MESIWKGKRIEIKVKERCHGERVSITKKERTAIWKHGFKGGAQDRAGKGGS